MFVPIDLLVPILGDLMANGRVSGPGRPWLGVNAQELHGRLVVGRVSPGSPAEKSGLRRGDVIVGVNGEKHAHARRVLSQALGERCRRRYRAARRAVQAASAAASRSSRSTGSTASS